MPIYTYQALPPPGTPAPGTSGNFSGGNNGVGVVRGSKPIRGTITADSLRHARDQLRERRLEVLAIAPLASTLAWGGFGRLFAGLFGSDAKTASTTSGRPRYGVQLVTFVRELSTLLAVGTPMVEALDTVLRQNRGGFGRVLLQVRDQVGAGVPLSQAMGDHPRVFDNLTRRLIEVGERAGNLDEVLDRLAQFKERAQSFRGRIGNALIYPVIVLTMAVLVSLLLMTFVVPNILEPLIQSGRPLPGPTVVVKFLSDFVIGWWWLIGLVSVAGVLSVGVGLRTQRGRYWRDSAMLKLPVIGPIARKQETVKVATVIATLIKSGIPFLEAVQVARNTVQNLLVKDALEAIHQSVSSGGDIAQAVERTQVFPPTVVQVFALGQESGRLESMLERLASDYDKQVQSAAQRLTALMEPALILVMAVLVGFIAFATILPILEAGQVL